MTQSLSSLRLTFLLDWTDRDKSLLLAVVTMPLQLLTILWVWYTDEYTRFGADYFSPDGVDLFYTILWVEIIIWSLFFAVGLLLRHWARDPWLYGTASILYYGISMLVLGYVVGYVTPVTGMVLLGASLVCFVLFDFTRVMVTFAGSVALLLSVSFAVSRGELGYAPLFVSNPFSAEDLSGYWLMSQCVVASPFVAAAFGITRLLIKRWQQREIEELKRQQRYDDTYRRY